LGTTSGVRGGLDQRNWMGHQDNVDGYVRYARERGVPGTIDSTVWVDDLNWSFIWQFPQDAVLSTDPAEGFTTWTLNY
jgi:hypothetical protein